MAWKIAFPKVTIVEERAKGAVVVSRIADEAEAMRAAVKAVRWPGAPPALVSTVPDESAIELGVPEASFLVFDGEPEGG